VFVKVKVQVMIRLMQAMMKHLPITHQNIAVV
jgi:hypothetical protein